MKTVSILVGFASFTFLLGTMGAMETNTLTLAMGTIRMCIGVPVLIASVMVAKRL